MNKAMVAALGVLVGLAAAACPSEADARSRSHRSVRLTREARHASEPTQRGIASVYAEHFRGRRMADGTRFDPASDAAASKSLPLGTTAQVTNLRNGRTATVRIRDRGPHRAGRIIDVSPGSAGALGMSPGSTAAVTVARLGRGGN